MKQNKSLSTEWPVLDFAAMQGTIETMHQWIQIIGKIRLKTMPWQNHSWHCTLYLSPVGYTTNAICFGGGIFEIELDFVHHQLHLKCSNAETQHLPLQTMSVADFYNSLFEKLAASGIDVEIHGSPNEMEPAIPFAKNTASSAYAPEAANLLWKAMLKSNGVFNTFRSGFIGKSSPVHLFWGAFDLAVTRFSGRPAPLHQGGAPNMPLDVMQEAYSHEVSSAGFWPGSKDSPMAVYYAYAYPGNEAYAKQKVLPEQAFYSPEMGEFFLKYEDVQSSSDPEKTLINFLQTTYEAAANTSGWDRKALER
ncbi:DUF5996 family protein [uncultured Cyclobacterium sp.]|uniref:DUF5996 family protein n=1 Tax=uncultured Cyclobacterium sp. TaxID=453820 RepID=UPI0030ED9207